MRELVRAQKLAFLAEFLFVVDAAVQSGSILAPVVGVDLTFALTALGAGLMVHERVNLHLWVIGIHRVVALGAANSVGHSHRRGTFRLGRFALKLVRAQKLAFLAEFLFVVDAAVQSGSILAPVVGVNLAFALTALGAGPMVHERVNLHLWVIGIHGCAALGTFDGVRGTAKFLHPLLDRSRRSCPLRCYTQVRKGEK